ALEVGLFEPEQQQLHRSDGHGASSGCPVPQLAPVGGDGPDDEDVDGDDGQRPERVVGDEQEVGDGAEHGHGDPDDPGPGAAGQQPPAGERHDQPDHQVDPAPDGGV